MTKVLEKNVAEIIVVSVFLLTFLSSCSNTHYLCDAYASVEQVDNCENCDQID
jgi:hypothetical protein